MSIPHFKLSWKRPAPTLPTTGAALNPRLVALSNNNPGDQLPGLTLNPGGCLPGFNVTK